jgi:mono/diheme cytochrome c family protein
MRKRLPMLLLATGVVLASLGARTRAVRPSPPPAPDVAGPTFNREISRIFQAHCDSCHHPGDIAPFSLMTFKEAHEQAANIKFMTSTKQMPPWKATSGCGEFQDVRELSQSEIDLIAEWVKNGAPEGKAAEAPAPLVFDGEWTLGTPDLVLKNTQPFLPPSSGDEYRCFSLPVPEELAKKDLYVSAFDIRPGDRPSVHHAIAFIDPTGESAAMDNGNGYQCFGGPGFSSIGLGALGGWAPGARPAYLPDGTATRLLAGSRVVLQIHYHPHNGKTAPDQTQLGLYFSKKPVQKILGYLPVMNNTFTIPAGVKKEVTGGVPFLSRLPFPVHIIGVFPHMHLIGKQMNVSVEIPNAGTQCLINVPDWDFNWQGMYMFKTPIALPAGSKPIVTAMYDNTTENFRNPNVPPKAVSWGEATTDEMCIAFLAYTLDGENLQDGKAADRSWAPGLFGEKPPALK